jgi:acetyltransferase-like isoleucine patch superfamily enzyme
VIEDNVVLGKRPRLSRHSSAARAELPGLVLAARVTVCAGAIVFAGAHVGEGAILGDQSFVRERSKIGAGAVIGRGSVVEPDVVVGARSRVQTNVYLTCGTLLEEDVFVGPGVVTTNDDTMARHDSSYELRGAILRRACRVGGGAVLVPGVEVGEEAFVAAGAVVTRDVPARSVVAGVPARVVRDVSDADLLEHWR